MTWLQNVPTDDELGRIVDELRVFHHDAAANLIERLYAYNVLLKRAVGEEGRANRMTLLYESECALTDWLAAALRDAHADPDTNYDGNAVAALEAYEARRG